jgi:hypothetical protein
MFNPGCMLPDFAAKLGLAGSICFQRYPLIVCHLQKMAALAAVLKASSDM